MYPCFVPSRKKPLFFESPRFQPDFCTATRQTAPRATHITVQIEPSRFHAQAGVERSTWWRWSSSFYDRSQLAEIFPTTALRRGPLLYHVVLAGGGVTLYFPKRPLDSGQSQAGYTAPCLACTLARASDDWLTFPGALAVRNYHGHRLGVSIFCHVIHVLHAIPTPVLLIISERLTHYFHIRGFWLHGTISRNEPVPYIRSYPSKFP